MSAHDRLALGTRSMNAALVVSALVSVVVVCYHVPYLPRRFVCRQDRAYRIVERERESGG